MRLDSSCEVGVAKAALSHHGRGWRGVEKTTRALWAGCTRRESSDEGSMRTLIRWAARLYPEAWCERYGPEFDALLEDMSPSLGDVCDVVRDALRARVSSPKELGIGLAPGAAARRARVGSPEDGGIGLAPVAGSSVTARLPVAISLSAHALLMMLFLAAAVDYVSPMPSHRAIAPSPS